MTMAIHTNFDGGNIEPLVFAENTYHLNIRKDKAAANRQWFYFKVDGCLQNPVSYVIDNAHQCSYADAWDGYDVVASYDQENWFRVPAQYLDGTLRWQFSSSQDSVYFSYFAPYDLARHQQLLCDIRSSDLSREIKSIATVEQNTVEIFKISADQAALVDSSKRKLWIIARQHPGETMAEWFMQGLLERLLNKDEIASAELLKQADFYVVVNMNPDGSWAGNLRTNGAGTDLNRAWAEPSEETSPEVLGVRDAMDEIGVDLFLDVHGDEELPYVFTAGCEGNPDYSDRLAGLESLFRQRYQAINPDFQSVYGYEKDEPGKADLRVACNQIGQRFDCLAFTIEMPFKDNANIPDAKEGWSPKRSMDLGKSTLELIAELLPKLR